MTAERIDEKSVFNTARQIADAAARDEFLQQACGTSGDVLQRIRDLLRVHAEEHSFLESPACAHVSTIVPSSLVETVGTVIGQYKLLEQIGEGGFGVVFMAEQAEPVRRKVALKVLKPGMDTRQIVARFEAERQALALMDHPNIATVFDGGTTLAGRPYFVMELVKGSPITEYCDTNRLSPRERLELFVTVCQAVQHAHQKGIIHRDLKPSNVLVAIHDTVPVVKVIDFGVAKALGRELTDKTLFTGFAQMIGTPLYMSPEQAGQSGLDVDTRSDVYSLGVLLYELLTGTTPFSKDRLRQAAYDEIRRIIQEEEPPRPSTRLSELGRHSAVGAAPSAGRQGGAGSARPEPTTSLASVSAVRKTDPHRLSRLVQGELDWIVMKALDKDRTRRFATAQGFARDVQRFLDGEAVEACPPSAAYRLRKFLVRNKGVMAMATTGVTALLVTIIGLAVSNWRVAAERDRKVTALKQEQEAVKAREAALRERGIALAEKDAALGEARTNFAEAQRQELIAKGQQSLARRRFYAAQVNLAMQAWRAGETIRVFELLEELRPRADEEDLRGFEWYYLWRLCQGGRRHFLHGHRNAVVSLAFSPTGETLASAGFDRQLKLWDPQSGTLRETLTGHFNQPWHVVYAPDGKTFASGGKGGGPAIIWDAASGQPMHILQESFDGLDYSPDGRTVAGGGASVHLWDVASGQLLSRLEVSESLVGFTADGQGVVTISDRFNATSELRVWNLQTRQRQRSLPVTILGSAVLSADRSRVATSSWGNLTRVWDVATGRLHASLPISSGVTAFSPDGKRLACSTEEKMIALVDIDSGRRLATDVHLDPVAAIAFSPDGKILASSTSTGTVKLWDMTPQEEATTIDASFASDLRFTPDGQALLQAGAGPTRVIDVATGAVVRQLDVRDAVSISGDAETLVLRTDEGWKTVRTQSGTEGARVRVEQHDDGAHTHFAAVVSADARTLATFAPWSGNNALVLWDLATRKRRVITPPKPFSNRLSVLCAEFSPDGKLVAAGYQFQWFAVFELQTGQTRLALSQPPDLASVKSVAFSPDGRQLAVGTTAGGLSLWDVETGRNLATFRGHTQEVTQISFSPDGSTLASAGADHVIRLWDPRTGQERGALAGHNSGIEKLVFSPDGSVLATASSDGTIKLWRAATDPEAVRQRRSSPVADNPFRVIARQYAETAWWLATTTDPTERDPARAVELASKGVQLAERSDFEWLTLALASYRISDWKGTLEAIDTLESLDPSTYPNHRHFLRAMALWQLGDRDAARNSYALGARWFQEQPSRAVYTSLLHPEAATLLGMPVPQRSPLLPSPKQDQESSSAFYSLAHRRHQNALALHQQGKFAEAEAEFFEVLRRMPGRVTVLMELAATQRELKKYAEAEATLREAEKLNPPSDRLQDAFGWLFARQRERLPEAEAAFRAAIEVDPLCVSAHCGLARTFEVQGRPADAAEWWSATLRLDPQHRWAIEALGWNLRALKRYDEAEAQFHAAIRQYPELAGAHVGLGCAFKDQGKLREAVESFERGLRLAPNADWYAELAQALAGLGRVAEAEAACRESLRLKPDSFGGRVTLAALLLDQSRPIEAEDQLHEAQRLEPGNEWARALVERARVDKLLAQARLAAVRHDWKSAAQTLEAGFETAPPDNGAYWFALALARVASGDVNGYEKLAQAMPAAFAKHDPPTEWQLLCVCRVCTLRPGGAADPQWILGQARRLCEFKRDNWNVFLLGLAEYRAGELEPALTHIEEACRIGDWHDFWPALAMTQHRLGHFDAARERLKRAEAQFEQMTAAFTHNLQTSTGDPCWENWPYFEAMLLEARETLGEEKATSEK